MFERHNQLRNNQAIMMLLLFGCLVGFSLDIISAMVGQLRAIFPVTKGRLSAKGVRIYKIRGQA